MLRIYNLSIPEKDLKFLYLAIFVLVVSVFSNFYTFSPNVIFALFIGFLVVYFMYQKTEEYKNEMFKSIKSKIDYLNLVNEQGIYTQQTSIGLRKDTYIPGLEPSTQIGSYFHNDINLVNLLYNIRDYESYSPTVYRRILRITNYFLKIWEDMQYKDSEGKIALANCATHYQVAQKLYKTGSNYFHSFVYSLPTNTYYPQKYKKTMERYRRLMKNKLEEMKNISRNQTKSIPINSNTVFIPRFNGPRSMAPDEDQPFYWFL